MPWSSARSMMAKLSGSVVFGPKFMVPRQSRLTFSPVRPRFVYSMGATLPLRARSKATSRTFAGGRRRAEQYVVPAGQALAWLVATGLVRAGRGTTGARAQYGQGRYRRYL